MSENYRYFLRRVKLTLMHSRWGLLVRPMSEVINFVCQKRFKYFPTTRSVSSWYLDYWGTSHFRLGDSTGSMYSAGKRGEEKIVEGDMATTIPGLASCIT